MRNGEGARKEWRVTQGKGAIDLASHGIGIYLAPATLPNLCTN